MDRRLRAYRFADVSDPLRAYSQRILNPVGSGSKMSDLWGEMGYTTGNGRDMTSVMYRMDGPPIHEQTLGSADAMLLRLLDDALETFGRVYAGERPGFLEGYAQLKSAIKPWGT